VFKAAIPAGRKRARLGLPREHFQLSKFFNLGDDMNLGIIILAVCLVPALVVGSVLLWVGTNAMLYWRRITRDVAFAIASVRSALGSIYDDTVRESLPDDFLDLVGKLTNQGSAKTKVT
jgi:hypothetical protein